MSKHKNAEVIKAWADGETIQLKFGGEWVDFIRECYDGPWNYDPCCEWRIKPKSVTIWVNVYPLDCLCPYDSKQDADRNAESERIACVPLTYTIGEGL